MTESEASRLKRAVEADHGGVAGLIRVVAAQQTRRGETAWVGAIHVFALEGHPDADRAYAWSQTKAANGQSDCTALRMRAIAPSSVRAEGSKIRTAE